MFSLILNKLIDLWLNKQILIITYLKGKKKDKEENENMYIDNFSKEHTVLDCSVKALSVPI